MNIISNDKPATKPKESAPRQITVTHGEPHDGRLPVVVTVVPTKDLDAAGGIFVDIKKGTSEAKLAKHPEGDLAPRAQPIESSEKTGVMAAAKDASTDIAEAGVKVTAAVVKIASPPNKLAPAPLPKASAPDGKDTREPHMTHQIAKAMRLTIGQAESFRAEIAMPAASGEGESWYMRGRAALEGGRDECSAWQKI